MSDTKDIEAMLDVYKTRIMGDRHARELEARAAILAAFAERDARIAELERNEQRLKSMVDIRDEQIAELEAVHIGAIPATTDYANGWNDCRQAMFAARKGVSDE